MKVISGSRRGNEGRQAGAHGEGMMEAVARESVLWTRRRGDGEGEGGGIENRGETKRLKKEEKGVESRKEEEKRG